jgi:hypothetical protein
MADEVVPLTETQARALQIIREHNIVMARQFARFMWPVSDGWSTHTNCGRGVSKGGGMNLAAGGYLGKLRRRKLINGTGGGRRFVLTDLGIRSLEVFEILQRNDEAREAIIHSPDEEDC